MAWLLLLYSVRTLPLWDIRSHSTQHIQLRFTSDDTGNGSSKDAGAGGVQQRPRGGVQSLRSPCVPSPLGVCVLCPLCCLPTCATTWQSHFYVATQTWPDVLPAHFNERRQQDTLTADLVFSISVGKTEYFVMPYYIFKFRSSLRP